MLPMDSLPFPSSKPTFCLGAVCGKAQDSNAGCTLHAINLAAKATLHPLGVGPHPDTCDMSNASGLLDMMESDKVEFEDDDSVSVCRLDVEMDEADCVDARAHSNSTGIPSSHTSDGASDGAGVEQLQDVARVLNKRPPAVMTQEGFRVASHIVTALSPNLMIPKFLTLLQRHGGQR
ncbi:hypothetical protein BT69DRAFT_1291742 [Atractiella rhizophila]|nr:hypothetical protein BT69DRAFT_1291742 [Atractiella rhizophila]